MSEHKVQWRGGFSDRNKISPVSTAIQLTEFDQRTRNAFLNLISQWITLEKQQSYGSENDSVFVLFNYLIQKVYAEFVDDKLCVRIRYEKDEIFQEYVSLPISEGNYDVVLTLVEFFALWFKTNGAKSKKSYYNPEEPDTKNFYLESLEEVLNEECVGYRMIDDKFVAITDPVEIKEIEDSLGIDKYQGTKSHIQKALGFLADREHPDYKNSIKESISAVESICKIIVGRDNATLGDALKILESKRGLKGQLKAGFEKLYKFTNDKGGIRHAEGLFESDVTFEEAKYMLVSCCAFVNYLIAEYGKTLD